MYQLPEMILFDYGGTLCCEPEWDMLRGEKILFEHVIANPHAYSPEDLSSWESAYYQSLQPVRDLGAEPTEIQMLRTKYELHGIKLDISYEEAELIFWDHVSPMKENCLYPHVRKMLKYLTDNHIRTGIVSNIGWTGTALKRRIHTLLPDHHFEFILASSDYGLRKPDGRLFQIALEKAALRPADIWFCGDTYDKDVEGAQAAGMFTVYYQGYTDGGACRESLNHDSLRNTPVITDWDELIEFLNDRGLDLSE